MIYTICTVIIYDRNRGPDCETSIMKKSLTSLTFGIILFTSIHIKLIILIINLLYLSKNILANYWPS